jgi:hypothetical protein
MPPQYAEPSHVSSVTFYLASRELRHLRARKYGQLVIIESGPQDDPIPHARLRRDTVHLWTVEVATHTGRWEKTGFRGQLWELLDLLTTQLPWTLASLD